jgi:ketosteroid isomerase-like protein
MPARTPVKKSVKKSARRSAKTHAAKSTKTHATTPTDVDRLFGEYLNAADLDALVDLYEADAALGQIDGTEVRGHRAIRKALNGLRAAQAKIEMNVVKAVEGGADVAVLFNDWRIKAVGPDEKPVEMTGKSLEVVRRQKNGTWRFVIDLPYARG